MSKVVVALGGNALGKNPQEQQKLLEITAQKIVELVKQGHDLIIGHGNGPQVGMIFNAFGDAKKANPETPIIPFPEAGAMSQGYIGLHMLVALTNQLRKAKIDKEVIYLLTQTIVSEDDPAFQNPTKPVGPFYPNYDLALANNPNSIIVEDAGRGFRKVVASPIPIGFLGIDAINKNIDLGKIVIVGGGGGIPTIEREGIVKSVDGVIDKDFALAKIAELVEADQFIILTAVDHIYLNYNSAEQVALAEISAQELSALVAEGHFAKGSMLPKVEAAISFVNKKATNQALVANLEKIESAIEGKSGTKIVFRA